MAEWQLLNVPDWIVCSFQFVFPNSAFNESWGDGAVVLRSSAKPLKCSYRPIFLGVFRFLCICFYSGTLVLRFLSL